MEVWKLVQKSSEIVARLGVSNGGGATAGLGWVEVYRGSRRLQEGIVGAGDGPDHQSARAMRAAKPYPARCDACGLRFGLLWSPHLCQCQPPTARRIPFCALVLIS